MGLWSWTQAPFFPWNMRQVENVVLQRVRAVTRRRVGQHLHHLSTTSTEAGNRKEQNNPNCNTNMKENSNISKTIISSYEFPSPWSVCGFLMSLFPQETIVWFQESMIIRRMAENGFAPPPREFCRHILSCRELKAESFKRCLHSVLRGR